MSLLEVEHVQKIYTTRFGGNQVQALADVSFRWTRVIMWPLWERAVPVRLRC